MNRQTTQQYWGKYRGIVTDNNDPNHQGRIKAHVKELFGGHEIGWALPCAPYAGAGEGQFSVPPAGAGVWIEFESGYSSRPIWSGCWWGENQVPEDNSGTAATPPLKIIRSETGLMVTLDDNSQTITVSDSNGQNMLEIKVQRGKITLKGATKAIVEAPQIELVENATHPVVFGDNLLQYLNRLVTMLNTHVHQGQTVIGIPVSPAPPQGTFPSARASLVSTRVKSG